MRRETRKYLHDIQLAIGRLQEFTDSKTFGDYSRDAMRRAAVERQFEIITYACFRNNLERVRTKTRQKSHCWNIHSG
ncbi:MAG: hypothetical protein OXG17_10320 [Chloroflexi bacterium]|nr:hypothetical protein [Chloroflexota bacterium]